MDNELLDIFTERMQTDVPLIEEHVRYMQTDKHDATAKLFRLFHNYKASASYLELNELYQLVAMGENILNSLRMHEGEPTQHDVDWLNAAASQLNQWCKQLAAQEALTPAEPSLFPTIGIIDENEKTTDIMKGLTLFYADTSLKRAAAMQAPLSHIFKIVKTTDSVNELKTAILNNSVDIIILNLQNNTLEAALEILQMRPDMAIVAAIPDLRPNQKSRLLLKGLTHPITSPIQSKDLKRQLHNIVTSHFAKVHSVVSHQKIYDFIQGLDPLSSSVKKIIRLCDDPDSSIKELIETINADAIIAANILHAAASPIYGISKTSSINQAVTAFGKRMIKAITLSDLAYKLGSLKLESYGIDEEAFKQTSALRLALMDRWYAQIDEESLPLLSASAILGNLGSILIDQELHAQGLVSEFKNYRPERTSIAEVALLKTSTAYVTADILEFWGLETELVDSIRYSDSPFNSGSERMKSLCCANAIVYKMVTPYGKLLDEPPKEVQRLLSKSGFDRESLEAAVHILRDRL